MTFDLAAAGATVDVLKGAFDVTKSFLGLRDAAVSHTQIAELNGKILAATASAISAQQAQVALLDQVSGLKKQVSDMENWNTEKDRYELREVSSWRNTAYVLKAGMENGEPPHCICPACFQRHQKFIMQSLPELVLRRRIYQCPSCKCEIAIDKDMSSHASP